MDPDSLKQKCIYKKFSKGSWSQWPAGHQDWGTEEELRNKFSENKSK